MATRWFFWGLCLCFSLKSRAFSSFSSYEFAPNGVCIRPRYFGDPNEEGKLFAMRNVPGQGDCMFLAVALATLTSVGLGGNDALLRSISRETRQVVATVLEADTGNLVIERNRLVPAKTLLKSAAKTEGLSPEQYLTLLRKEGRNGGLYGGGPELTVLANVLRRPISIYELFKDEDEDGRSPLEPGVQPIQQVGVFGAETFPDPLQSIPDSAVLSSTQPAGAYSWHLHILVLDVSATEKHACVLLPQ